MPLLSYVCAHAALGVLVALCASTELRGSTRPVPSLGSFRALLVYEALLGAPGAAYLLFRAPDWSVSYLLDAARLPPLLHAFLSLLAPCAAVLGLLIGARWVREGQQRWLAGALAALAALALIALFVGRHRLAVVGTYGQFRGGFALRGLRRSELWPTLPWLLLPWALAAAHVCARASRAPTSVSGAGAAR